VVTGLLHTFTHRVLQRLQLQTRLAGRDYEPVERLGSGAKVENCDIDSALVVECVDHHLHLVWDIGDCGWLGLVGGAQSLVVQELLLTWICCGVCREWTTTGRVTDCLPARRARR